MTIAYVMRYWPVYGGGETVTAILTNELVRRGHTVHILYTYRNDISPMPYDLDNRIHEMKINTVDFSTDNVKAIARYLKDNRIDIMVNQWGDQRLCYEAKNLSGTKLVICWHMSSFREYKPVTLKQKIYRLLGGHRIYQKWRNRIWMDMHMENYRMADRYVFLSKYYEQEFVKAAKNKIVAYKLDSIPNPLTNHLFFDINNYSDKKKEVLFVGRMYEDHKRLSYILRIWKQIETDVQLSDWSLRIVGDGPAMQATKQLCVDLRLLRVSFDGFKDPRPFYEEASIFIMTSAFEGFPMTLVESMQHAVVPIVMESFAALHDIITNRGNGVIIENNNINNFVYALKELMLKETYRKQLARNGLISIKKYEINRVVDMWENLFMDSK